ncbi:hypothetical protein CAPTEDRAFT_48421, partial [Capitella teleta]
VEQWVGDKLHEILGISDRTIAEYFVGMAKKSSSPQDLVEGLKKTGTVDIDATMKSFANELWGKVPHKLIEEKPARAVERAALELQKRNMAYKLLSDSDE